MALTKVTGGLISTTSNYEVGVITATKFVGPIEGGVTGITTGSDKIKVIDESSDTTCFPLFATHSDGYLAAKSGSNLTFNSNNGTLTATTFSGALTGNVNGNATGLSGTPSIVVKDITAEMVSVAGTVQYEDVVNVDATGIVTAGGGLVVPANKMVTISGDLNVDGKTDIDDLSVSGVSTFTGLTTFSDNIRIADSKKILLGNLAAGDCQFIHDGSDTFIQNKTGDLKISNNVAGDVGGNIIIQAMNGENSINCVHDAQVELSFNGSQKLATTATGIAVTGEVAATQDYPNIRPVLDFNFAATKKLDPRMEFYSTGEASYHDGVGSVKFVYNNVPRFEHDIVTGECKGLMFETAGTNYSWYSRTFDSIASGSWVPQNGGATPTVTANTYTAPDGTSSGVYMADTITGATGTAFNGNVVQQQHTAGANVKHTFSMYIKLITSTQATIYIRDGASGSISSASAIPNTRNWQRVVVTSSAALTNSTVHSFYFGNTNGTIAVWGSQIERSDYVSSYIKTEAGANGTRTADDGGVRLGGEDVTDIFNQGEGTLIAEAIPTLAEANQGIVGFYQDFGSVNRVELRAMGTNTANARFESVVGSSSVATMTGSAHAGVNNVSKYAFAFQENNYAASVNGGTVETDTSGAFPHGTGINSMIIGDTVYAKDHSMIIKRVMYYADRLPDSQLVTLTS